ncbi:MULTISPECIES: DUF7553 family protein [Halorussus]|uniref:DUF7553 family protein n=1 Tax=Halorussus TaxID=1070314 RepID=UPI00209F70F7|nr:hypothetical protein [Halorussus vallis]USZ77295.1 hypothetical protein NGM07_08180 [Halorussus vallis]
MSSLPPVIDIRDDLDAARESTGDDLNDEFETIRDRLDAFAERDRAGSDSEGVLDEIDNQLLRLEERTDGDASRRIAAARNRIHIYRDSLDETASGLAVVESTARDRAEREAAAASNDPETSDADGGEASSTEARSGRRGNAAQSSDADDGRQVAQDRILPVGEVTVTVTVANGGDDRTVAPVVTIYDEHGDDLGSASGPPVEIEAGEQRRIEIDVDVPKDGSYYATSLVEADGDDRVGRDQNEYNTDTVT